MPGSTLFGSVVELGYALSQSILAADGPYPNAETAAPHQRSFDRRSSMFAADRRDRLLRMSSSVCPMRGISTRSMRSSPTASHPADPAPSFSSPRSAAIDWAIYSNDPDRWGGQRVGGDHPRFQCGVSVRPGPKTRFSHPTVSTRLSPCFPDRQRVLALYASALDERAPPEEAAVFATVGRKTMDRGS